MKFLLLIFITLSSYSIANANIDSLQNLLSLQENNKKDKTAIYLLIAKEYWNTQLDSCELYTNKALALANKNINEEYIAKSLLQKSLLLNHLNENNEAQKILRRAKNLIKKNNFKNLLPALYSGIGRAYRNTPDSSLHYYNKSIAIAKEINSTDEIIDSKLKIALILLHQKKYADLSTLLNKILPEIEKSKDYDNLMTTYTYMALAFRDLNDKDKSLMYAHKALNLVKLTKDKKQQAFVLGAIGGGITGYFEAFEKAEPLVKQSLDLAIMINDKPFIKTSNKRLAILYYNNDDFKKANEIIDKLLQDTTDPDVLKTKAILLSEEKKYKEADTYFDSAYKLYEKDGAYIHQKMILLSKIDNKLAIINDEELTSDFLTLDSLNEIIHSNENKNQFFDLETKYRTAEKEAEIQKKELDLVESRNKITTISLIGILALIISIFIIWYLRNKEKRKELEHTNNVLSLQSLLNNKELESINNQLNPHEIKNLITSIAPELLTKAPETYKKMIKLFNVTRSSLSDELTEDLSTQLNQIQDYLELQQSISPHVWEFEIINKTNIENVQLPRLILKNMVENAVKYGIKNNNDQGKIIVEITQIEENIHIQVKDNGKSGIENIHKTKTPGVGISAYMKLFKILNAKNDNEASLRLQRQDAWTCANIIIPLNYKYQ